MAKNQTVKEWLDAFSTAPISIWCEDPETNIEKIVGGVLGKTYFTYRILLKQPGRDIVGARHRYSEFELLRTSLKERYSLFGILVPSLPPKNMMNSIMSSRSDTAFIKERTMGLSMFCEAIVENPWLRNDSSWKAFMKSATMFAVIHENIDEENTGEIMLIAALAQLDLPYKLTMIQRMEDLKEEVLLIEKHVRVVLEKAKTMQSCERALVVANEAFNHSLRHWNETERGHNIRSFAGCAFDETDSSILMPHESIATSTYATSMLLHNKHINNEEQPNYTGVTIIAALNHELSSIESFKELFRVHEEILANIEALSSKLSKFETNRSAYRLDLINEARKALEEKQLCLTAFYKGFVFFTLPMYSRQRAATFRRATASVAAINLTVAYSLQKACLSFFSDLILSPQQAIKETCRTLELLCLKQLDQPPEDVIKLDLADSHDIRDSDQSFENLKLSSTAQHASCVDGLFEIALSISGRNAHQQQHGHGHGSRMSFISTSGPPPNLASSVTNNSNNFDSGATWTSSPASSTSHAESNSNSKNVNPLASRRGSAVAKKIMKDSDGTDRNSLVMDSSIRESMIGAWVGSEINSNRENPSSSTNQINNNNNNNSSQSSNSNLGNNPNPNAGNNRGPSPTAPRVPPPSPSSNLVNTASGIASSVFGSALGTERSRNILSDLFYSSSSNPNTPETKRNIWDEPT
eukprot:gene8420-11388_t